ncbi:MAG: pyrroline-5-carboxylate reductase [Verrucomicrobia bacterium]|nr:pyrroline-5-carboxylate reductase [Verrucomicrobiota bacterium]
MSEYRLGFVGFGHMAQILFEAMDAARLIPRSQVQFIQRDADKMTKNEQKYKITSTSMERLVSTSDILLLCVRPAQAEQAVSEMARFGASQKMIISVLAGVPIRFYQKHFGEKAQILRMMPNVASAVGEGMTIFGFSPHARADFRSAAQMLAAPLGPSMEVPETLFDAATGIAGSGPGFVFKLIQAMAIVAEKEGFTREQALRMASQVFIGAGRLVSKGENPADLMIQIATPGGTTEAGFNVMEKAESSKWFQETIEASIRKARFFADQY